MSITATIALIAFIYWIHEINISVGEEMVRERFEKREIETQKVLEEIDEEQKEERKAIRKELSGLLRKSEEFAEKIEDSINFSFCDFLTKSESKEYHRVNEDIEKLESRITEMDEERRYVELFGHREKDENL